MYNMYNVCNVYNLVWGLGITAFFLFFLYDWNRIFWKKPWMNRFFAVGCICLVICGGILAADAGKAIRDGRSGHAGYLWIALAAVCLLGLIYTLFFALPFDATYRKEADHHKVCRSGLYGLCRHPGIWWFFGCFLGLGCACADGRRILQGVVFSILNLAYAWYQDRFIFPTEFSDYEDYQKAVPFLIPGNEMKGTIR